MRGVDPPDNGEKDSVERREKVVEYKEVGKREELGRLLLLGGGSGSRTRKRSATRSRKTNEGGLDTNLADGLETPDKNTEGSCRVDVIAELSERAAGEEEAEQAVDAGDLVQNLERRGAD